MLVIDWRPRASNTPSSSVRGTIGVGSVGLLGSTTGVPQVGARVSASASGDGVVPQVAEPLTMSPTAKGPNMYMCTALTVSEPSEFTICSLYTTVKTSPTSVMTPERV